MNTEIEGTLIGAILLDNRRFFEASIDPRDFANERNRRIYGAIGKLLADDKPADVITVSEVLGANELPYLSQLAENTPSIENAPYYAAAVRKKARERRVKVSLKHALDSLEKGADLETLAGDLMVELQVGMVGDISAKRFDQAVDEAITSIGEAARQKSEGALGISTTIPQADFYLGGLYGPHVYILGGRPGAYKSTLAWQICARAAKAGTPVAMISLEMKASELAAKTFSREFELDYSALLHGNSDASASLAKCDTSKIRGWPVWIDDRAKSLSEIRSRITELKFKHDIKLAVVDHVQLIKTPSRNRFEELNEISRSFKLLSTELDLPLLVLSQLSRQVQREKRRPVLSDLRESGNLEQDSDAVLFLHIMEGEGQGKDTHELIIAKNRHGVGRVVVPLMVRGEQALIGELLP